MNRKIYTMTMVIILSVLTGCSSNELEETQSSQTEKEFDFHENVNIDEFEYVDLLNLNSGDYYEKRLLYKVY